MADLLARLRPPEPSDQVLVEPPEGVRAEERVSGDPAAPGVLEREELLDGHRPCLARSHRGKRTDSRLWSGCGQICDFPAGSVKDRLKFGGFEALERVRREKPRFRAPLEVLLPQVLLDALSAQVRLRRVSVRVQLLHDQLLKRGAAALL